MILDLIDKLEEKKLELIREMFFSDMDLDNKYSIERLKIEINTLERDIKIEQILG